MKAPLSAYQFNKALAPVLETIGAPLLKSFGINHFGLIKVNNQQSMLRIANHDKWNQIYTQEKFYNDLEMYGMSSIPMNGSRRRILTGNPTSKHEKILYEQDLWNFLLLYERTEKEGSFFFFGTDRNNQSVLDYYINYPNVFEHFVFYFKEHLAPFLKIEENKCIKLSINPLTGEKNNSKQIMDEFYHQTKISKFYLGENFKNINLTKREADCLFHLIHGQTTKEIARSLNLSPRTIESFINRLKSKTGISNKSLLSQKLFTVGSYLNQS